MERHAKEQYIQAQRLREEEEKKELEYAMASGSMPALPLSEEFKLIETSGQDLLGVKRPRKSALGVSNGATAVIVTQDDDMQGNEEYTKYPVIVSIFISNLIEKEEAEKVENIRPRKWVRVSEPTIFSDLLFKCPNLFNPIKMADLKPIKLPNVIEPYSSPRLSFANQCESQQHLPNHRKRQNL